MTPLLAQINIGHLKAPIDDPLIDDFSNNLDHINAIAESSNGFVWRLKDEENNATSFNPYNDELIIVNISVWESLEHLKQFVCHTGHVAFFKRRAEWFVPMSKTHMAMWTTSPDAMPSAIQGKERLDHLWKHGPSEYAFDYKTCAQYV